MHAKSKHIPPVDVTVVADSPCLCDRGLLLIISQAYTPTSILLAEVTTGGFILCFSCWHALVTVMCRLWMDASTYGHRSIEVLGSADWQQIFCTQRVADTDCCGSFLGALLLVNDYWETSTVMINFDDVVAKEMMGRCIPLFCQLMVILYQYLKILLFV